MVSLFHPNKSNTGSACSFSQNSKDGQIYATIIKQSSWDEAKRIGGFVESRNDPLKHINIKLAPHEVGAILDSLDRFRPFSTVHVSEKDTKSINFGLWIPKPATPDVKSEPKGYSFTINLTDKEDSTKKIGFYIALTFAEARLIREFLIYSLQNLFHINNQNFLAAAQQQQAPVSAKELI